MAESFPKIALIGEVKTADAAYQGLMRARVPPSRVFTTDVAEAMQKSGMDTSYYNNLSSLAPEDGIPLTQITAHQIGEALRTEGPDYIFVMGWPYLVPEDVLELAPCIGMHPTALPKRRGGAPMNWQIIDGVNDSAVTLFRLRASLDAGEIAAQRRFQIGQDDYVADVAERIYKITEDMVYETALQMKAGPLNWLEQDDAAASYTRRRNRADGRIHWNDSAVRIRNLVRACSVPFPGAFFRASDRLIKVWRADLPIGYRAPLKARPGEVLSATRERLLISTRDNAIALTDFCLEDGSYRGRNLTVQDLEDLVGRVMD